MSSGFTSDSGALRGARIAIWGVGLIGGSLGMAWRRAGVASEVIGIGRRPLDEAVRLGAIDRYLLDPAEAIAQADVLVLCAPVCTIIEQARSHARHVRPGAVVTDVGSTKLQIVRAWEEHLPSGTSFVGGHPMFGREVAGVENATPDLPRGCRYVLTPGDRSRPEAVAAVERLAAEVGGGVRIMTPAEHDARVAVASHVPQLLASAMAAGAYDADQRMGGVLDLAAGGFRDTTRIAESPANLWSDIFLTNGDAIRSALLIFRESLDALERAVERGDSAAVEQIFAKAHAGRRGISQSPAQP